MNVAQLIEQSLPTPEVHSSNPVNGKFSVNYQLFWKDEAGNGTLLKLLTDREKYWRNCQRINYIFFSHKTILRLWVGGGRTRDRGDVKGGGKGREGDGPGGGRELGKGDKDGFSHLWHSSPFNRVNLCRLKHWIFFLNTYWHFLANIKFPWMLQQHFCYFLL